MSDDPIDAILTRWNAGEAGAAEEAVQACEPYLRLVVRRQMSDQARAKFDSVDIVQSVWADVVDDFRQEAAPFKDATHLRAYLARRARHRLIDRVRQNRRAMQTEKRLDGETLAQAATREPQPSQVAQADDLWEQLRAECPPAHRELLSWKLQGLPIAEIAARSGLHEGSVRRIFYDLARRMSLGPDQPRGDA